MFNLANYAMVYLGSALMVYNIVSFINYIRHVQKNSDWGREKYILYVPLMLLISFLLGYLAVGIFGRPDLIVSGILFGGSLFVFIIFKLLWKITLRIQEDEHLSAKLMAAQATNQATNAFLSNMSHEMRTPMNAIIGLNDLILKDDISPKTRERLLKIDMSAHHMLDLINEVLDLNVLTTGQVVLKQESFSLREALMTIDVLMQEACGQKGLKYTAEIIGTPDDRFIGDVMRIKQVLMNVLNNAVKFTPVPGGVRFTIEQVDRSENDAALRFTVIDNGIGMDPDFRENLFDIFAREDGSNTNNLRGSGLGLAIVRRLLDLMGGDIRVESEKGKGSKFTIDIRLPLDPSARTHENVDMSLEGRRVLIVEDIDINAEIVADLLEIEGILTERAENGLKAVECFKSHPEGYYDAILMDLRMPVMDGLDATRSIRALTRPDAQGIPIIALTANAYPEDVQRSMQVGMNAHLAKPTDSEELVLMLKRCIFRQAV